MSASARALSPVVLLGVLLIIGIGIGSSWISPARVLMALIGNGTDTDKIIVWTLRLPRVLLAILAGAALALAGLQLQRVVRNPIASPSVLGIVDGAAVGVVLFLWLWSDDANQLTVSIHWLPLAATLGAASFAALVVLLAGKEVVRPLRLILYGIAMAALAKALVTLLIIIGPVYRASTALIWLAGSVHTAHWPDVYILATVLTLSVILLAMLTRQMDQILLDDQSASASGLSVLAVKGWLLAICVILTAAAVSFAGGIAFVGLIAPNIARALVGLRAGALLFVTPFIGASMVLGADILARVVAYPLELPTGAITALIGAPYFLFLLLRQVRHG